MQDIVWEPLARAVLRVLIFLAKVGYEELVSPFQQWARFPLLITTLSSNSEGTQDIWVLCLLLVLFFLSALPYYSTNSFVLTQSVWFGEDMCIPLELFYLVSTIKLLSDLLIACHAGAGEGWVTAMNETHSQGPRCAQFTMWRKGNKWP